MRPIDNEARITMNSRRNFVNYAHMVLSDGQELYLTPSDFRISGNNFTDDAVDGDSFQIGTAIGKTATILLDNTDGRTEIIGSSEVVYPHGKFSEYDFYMAYFELYLHLPNATHVGSSVVDQIIPIGTFTVTTPTSHGTTIEIIGVDNMYLFDRSFDECDLDFSTNPTLKTILNKCCADCGVAIGYTNFANENLTISVKPEDTTYRQVVSWIATIAGCNAKINVTGALILASYDMSSLLSLDGGTFTAIGREFQYLDTLTWNGSTLTWGQNAEYSSSKIPRSGRYKLTRINISNVTDPTNFDANAQITVYNSLIGNSTNRFNKTTVINQLLTIGDNVLNYEFDISTLNRKVYWFGVYGNNYGNPSASKFDFTIYIEPVSFADGDSADGGTFESEFQYYDATHWMLPTSPTTYTYWWYAKNILYTQIHPAGKYTITKVHIDNIADPSHFNADYIVQKSVDSGSTWTDEKTDVLVAGDNIINFDVDIPENVVTRYRILYRQNIVADPSASEFYATLYMKAHDSVYLDGDSFDGGDFSTPLGYHNLTAISGTSIGTDDIQITGVSVSYEEVSANYPTTSGWDYYAIEITENPFVAGHEATIAQTIYNALSGLKFRPFTTSSIQDPTIEAGDPCVVYDVKGNMYYSIITNVVFNTGGMTELSCHAEPPARQGSRYSAPVAVRRVANGMTTYQSQTAHFNEIASAALGYFRTDVADTDTGATITYLHDQATLESSQFIVKIANGIVGISDDGGVTYNQGFDASTGAMLLNLIYVHGLTSDWINTGELWVGGLDNKDGIIRVTNIFDVSSSVTMVEPDLTIAFFVGPGQISISGSYRIYYELTNIESGKTVDITCRIQKRDKWDSSTYTWKVIQDFYPITDYSGELPMRFDVDITDGNMYYYVTFSRGLTTNAKFTGVLKYNQVNTVIDNQGVSIRKGSIQLGTYNLNGNNHYPFEVDDAGNLHAENGEIAGLTTMWSEKGWKYDGPLSVYYNGSWHSGVLHYFSLSAYGGLTIGRYMDSSNSDASSACWSNLWWVQGYGMLQIDYGSSGNSYRGIIVTNVGNNKYWDAGTAYTQIKFDGVNVVSDRRSKKDISTLSKTLAKNLVLKSRPVKFKFIGGDTDDYHYGFIAQEIKEIAPDSNSIIDYNEDNDRYSMNYQEMIAPMIKVIQTQQEEIDDLKARIKALEDIVNAKLK